MKNIHSVFLAVAIVSGYASAVDGPEITGKVIHESATYTNGGKTIGASNWHDNEHFKAETAAKIYLDGQVDENSSYHVEIQGFNDSKALSNFDGNEEYTQRDPLREAYVDTNLGDWALRLGKQQVVWGTADGMKLLDAINPTDYSELAQNQMEDSRIPVFMINASKINDDGSEIQAIVSEARSNYIPGLSTIPNNQQRSTTATRSAATGMATAMVHNISAVDQGQAFIMKGVDTISGKENGFLNIVPELGEVAATFGRLSAGFAYNGGGDAAPSYHLNNWVNATVNEFVSNTGAGSAFGGACPNVGIGANSSTPSSAYCLEAIAKNTNEGQTNLLSGMDPTKVGFGGGTYSNQVTATNLQGYGGGTAVTGNWDATTPDTTFEYMPNATFKTFATFNLAKSKYVREDDGDSLGANSALKYRNTTESGINYSFNYMNGYDSMPYLDVYWQNADGVKLTPVTTIHQSGTNGFGSGTNYVSVGLTDTGTTEAESSKAYGYVGSTSDHSFTITNPVTLVFHEKHAKVHNLGGSIDTAIETDSFGPVVLRGEALYQKGVRTQIIDKAQLSIGNMSEAFSSREGDKFKYVLGADFTALTNMMVSLQFIQERNLNFVDNTTNIITTGGQGTHVTGARYTVDTATMSMSNQFQKALKNKEFYTLYLSKPFGESGQHRWNNLFMFEEGGGKWNRLDAEYTLDDDTILTAEFNKYFGNKNTQFGQFNKSSNVQVGLKYSF